MFSEAQRCLYEWVDKSGKTRGRYDPLAVRRVLILKTDDRIDDLLDQMTASVPDGEDDQGNPKFKTIEVSLLDRMKAEAEVVPAARAAFGLTPPQATDAEVIELLIDFLAYLGKPSATVAGSPNTSRSAVQAG